MSVSKSIYFGPYLLVGSELIRGSSISEITGDAMFEADSCGALIVPDCVVALPNRGLVCTDRKLFLDDLPGCVIQVVEVRVSEEISGFCAQYEQSIFEIKRCISKKHGPIANFHPTKPGFGIVVSYS